MLAFDKFGDLRWVAYKLKPGVSVHCPPFHPRCLREMSGRNTIDPALFMPLLKDLHRLRDRYREAYHQAKVMLDMATQLIETIAERELGTRLPRRTRIEVADWEHLPEVFEYEDGILHPNREQAWGGMPKADQLPPETDEHTY